MPHSPLSHASKHAGPQVASPLGAAGATKLVGSVARLAPAVYATEEDGEQIAQTDCHVMRAERESNRWKWVQGTERHVYRRTHAHWDARAVEE